MSTRKMLLEVDLESGTVVVLPQAHRSPPSPGAAGSVVQPAAPLWGAEPPPPPPAPTEAPNTSPHHEKPPLPADLQPKLDAWARLIADLLDGSDAWEGFEGLDPRQILEYPGVTSEIRCLQLRGVSNAHELVLRFGPRRCKEVRVWVEKRSKQQRVSNQPGLIASILVKGPPHGRR